MLRSIATSGLVALSLSVGGTLCAQDTSLVAIGARLRVRTASGTPWHYGTFGGVAADSLTLATASGQADRRYHIASLAAIEVRDARPEAQSAHIRNGAGVGAITGALIVYLGVRHCQATSRNSDGPPCALGYAGIPLFAIGGAVVGGGIGAVWPVRHWRRVSRAAVAARSLARPDER